MFPRWLLALVLLVLLPLAARAGAQAQPLAVEGRIELPASPAQPVWLQGQWGFAWQQFVDPDWQQLPARGFAPVPSSWNEVHADGKPSGENGWGSYLLLVNCPRGESLAIEALGQRTASRLFVNGTLVAQHGRPGPSPQASWAAVHNRVPITPEFACPLHLTLHVSNFDHRAGGFVRPIAAARADVLASARESRIIQHTALLAAYLLTALVALIFYGVRRRERTTLDFGLFCIAMAVYTDMIGERLFLRPVAPQVDWWNYMRVEYLTWLAAMALFLMTLRSLFPQEIRRRVVNVVLAALGIACVAVIVLPPAVYSQLVLPGQAIAVLVCGYATLAMRRVDERKQVDARILLAGMVAIVCTLAVDLLLIDSPGPDRKFSPIGFAFFLLSPAVIIARRLTYAEERGRALEENARLREDVERMSRHDMKTPLNSILGVTRLLRDDAGLNTDQRELVGVLQRAAMRMLEMVNLSLGLFRMETGNYDFRPQAVDLREVATRVLVDLHSYAEASGVTLNLHDRDATAVYARGEEPLCYSMVANLVRNAIEAAGAGQRVTVTLHRSNPVGLSVHNPGQVPPAIARRFFDKYVTAGKSGGTGLGTYSARMMARAQQGDLQLRTSAADGTTLTLSLRPLQGDLPVPQPAPAEAAPADWVREMPPREVLLVDDDEYTRLVTRRLLPSPPFSIETAANGQAAIESLSRRWPHYLLLDMEMPLKGGIETVQWLRETEASQGLPRCYVVMLSGNDDEASAERARSAGADRFLVKPASREALLGTLRELEGELQELERTMPAPLLRTMDTPDTVGAGLEEEEIVKVDPEWMEVFPDFLRFQRDTVEAMARALAAGDREDVFFLAHRATGGLATMGLDWAARQGRFLEQNARVAPAEELEMRIRALREHLRRVRIESA